MTGRLANRVALITGASRGIGASVAKRFAAEGAHVVLVARTRGGLEDVDDQIRSAQKEAGAEDTGATLLELDLKNLEQVDMIGPTIAERFGRLDIVVGNASLLGEMSPMNQGFKEDENFGDNWNDDNLVRRWGEPEDVANVAAFLASDDAAFVTGETINVDGGSIAALFRRGE